MGLPRLDVIFSLAARAVDVLVQGAWRSGFQVGDDEASIHAQWSGLDARDDSYDRMSVLMKVSRSILRMQRGLLAWGGPFLSAGDETWMRVAKFSLDWM